MKKIIALLAVSAISALAQNAENGRKMFEKIGCWECHGHVGQGGSAGPKLAPEPKPQAVVSAYVRKPGGQMPPYTTKVLSDSDMADIYAYLKSIPAGKPVKDIPLLNQ